MPPPLLLAQRNPSDTFDLEYSIKEKLEFRETDTNGLTLEDVQMFEAGGAVGLPSVAHGGVA
jgi:hypothetical protein